MGFYYLSKHLSPLPHSVSKVQSMEEDSSRPSSLQNKEIFRLFLSSCKSMRRTGHSCQLFGLEVFCRVSYSSQEIQSSLVNWKKKIPSVYYPVMLPGSDSISQDKEGLLQSELPSITASTKTLNEELEKWLLVRRKES